MTLHTLPLFETRSTAEGVVEGYGATFNGVDSYGDSIAPGAFAESLKTTRPLMLWQHRQDSPVGRWTELREDSRGLFVKGQLNMATAAGRDAFEHLRQQDVNGLSIGYRVGPDGVESKNGVRLLKAIDLQEISIVSLPADSRARVIAVKSQRPETLRDLQHALQELGYSRRQAVAILEKGYSGIAAIESEADEINALAERLRQINF